MGKKKSIKQKKRLSIIQKQAELDKAADDAWGDSDDEPQQQEDLNEDADDEDDIKEEEEVEIKPKAAKVIDQSPEDEQFHPRHKFKTIAVENDGMTIKTTEDKSVMAPF